MKTTMNPSSNFKLSRRPAPNPARLGVFVGFELALGCSVALPRENRCTRCGGHGWIDCYRHVEGGICFRCRGSGVDPSGAAQEARKARKAPKTRTARKCRQRASQAPQRRPEPQVQVPEIPEWELELIDSPECPF